MLRAAFRLGVNLFFFSGVPLQSGVLQFLLHSLRAYCDNSSYDVCSILCAVGCALQIFNGFFQHQQGAYALRFLTPIQNLCQKYHAELVYGFFLSLNVFCRNSKVITLPVKKPVSAPYAKAEKVLYVKTLPRKRLAAVPTPRQNAESTSCWFFSAFNAREGNFYFQWASHFFVNQHDFR